MAAHKKVRKKDFEKASVHQFIIECPNNVSRTQSLILEDEWIRYDVCGQNVDQDSQDVDQDSQDGSRIVGMRTRLVRI